MSGTEVSVFDEARLQSLERDLGKEDVRELLMEFVTQMRVWIAALTQAPVSPPKTMRELAHAIGSSATMIGAVHLERAARALEHHVGSEEAMRALRDEVLAQWSVAERQALTRA
jgi:HPt (histidine-containing phosphotransfer) domain-containing protein